MRSTSDGSSTIDVLGLGCAAVDTLLYLPSYPDPDGKIQVLRSERQCGGQTVNALVAATRLGCRCAFAGWLGTNDDSAFLQRTLETEGVDVQHAQRQDGVTPIRTTILVDTKANTRTILYDLAGTRSAPQDTPESVIQSAKILYVDHYGIEGMLHAAKVAKTSGIPIVGDFEHAGGPGFSELLPLVDHLILSFPFAKSITNVDSPEAAAHALWHPEREAVAITWGTRGSWYVTKDSPNSVNHQPAFQVPVVDTTGCGDAFHGAYMAALVEGLEPRGRFEFASAAAALKASQPGAQRGMPNRAQLQEFLNGPPTTYLSHGDLSS